MRKRTFSKKDWLDQIQTKNEVHPNTDFYNYFKLISTDSTKKRVKSQSKRVLSAIKMIDLV